MKPVIHSIVVILVLLLIAASSVPILQAAPLGELITIEHFAQPGDSLLDVALFYKTTTQEISELNSMADTSIGMGDRLTVPVDVINRYSFYTHGTGTYTVQSGDTLAGIANAFNVSLISLAVANRIDNVNLLEAGAEITIPDQTMLYAIEHGNYTIEDAPRPSIVDGKQIVVSLTQQRTYAYENGVLQRVFLVSTGLEKTPTIEGDFEVYIKLEADDMSGPGYALDGVPWVMYFYSDYALHGTYWHNNFGSPMSHGCVNFTPDEAAWLFEWAELGTSVLVVP